MKVVDSGCCGMAGSFGYEHYDLSLAIGERVLFPAVREHRGPVVAPGFSCRHQIGHGAGRAAVHPIELLAAQAWGAQSQRNRTHGEIGKLFTLYRFSDDRCGLWRLRVLPSMMVVRVVRTRAKQGQRKVQPGPGPSHRKNAHRARFLPVRMNRACFPNRPGLFFSAQAAQRAPTEARRGISGDAQRQSKKRPASGTFRSPRWAQARGRPAQRPVPAGLSEKSQRPPAADGIGRLRPRG